MEPNGSQQEKIVMQLMEGERGIVLTGFMSEGEIVHPSSSGIQVEEQEKVSLTLV